MTQNEEIKIIKKVEPLTRDKLDFKTSMDLTLRENFYIDCQKYYEREFGFPILSMPEDLLQSDNFKKITVQRALGIFQMFNLIPKDSSLFYFALLYDALPMPPDIIEVRTEGGVEYHFNGTSISNVLRPTYFYVKEIIEYLKDKTSIVKTRVEEFTMFDTLSRPFKVNLKRVYNEYLSFPDQRHLINYTQLSESRSNLIQGAVTQESNNLTYAEKYKMENLKRMRDIMGKNYSIELASDMSSSRL